MLALIRVFWDIVLLRRGPRDLPASLSLLGLLALLDLGVSLVALYREGAARALTLGLVDVAFTFAVFYTLLTVRKVGHRVVQTLSALWGTGVVLAAVQIALLTVASSLLDQDTATAVASTLSNLFLLWGVLVIGHIVRRALEVHLATGLTIALTYVLVSILIYHLWPAPVTA